MNWTALTRGWYHIRGISFRHGTKVEVSRPGYDEKNYEGFIGYVIGKERLYNYKEGREEETFVVDFGNGMAVAFWNTSITAVEAGQPKNEDQEEIANDRIQ